MFQLEVIAMSTSTQKAPPAPKENATSLAVVSDSSLVLSGREGE